MHLNDDQVAPLLDLYDRGLYLQAYQVGQAYGPMKDWTGPRGRIMASRLAVNLGAPRMSRRQRIMAWRETPGDAEVLYYHGYTMLERKGPLETWRFLNQQTLPENASAEIRSSWYTLHAQAMTVLRDFDVAEEWLKKAEQIAPDNPWVHVNWVSCYEEQDRYDDALASVNRALELRNWYRPAVQAMGHLLPLLGRDDEAYEFLKEASVRLESCAVQFQLAAVLLEREAYDELRNTVRAIDELCPLMEDGFAKSLASLRSLIAYRLGDLDAAIEFAKLSKDKFETKLVERLADPARRERKRVRLPVGFVRQHHRTCAPAVLSSISQFWSKPAEHLQIADAICYDGTTSYNERRWADENGWYPREFTLTEQSAQELIDAGIPFTLTTTNPGSGHLQAVIGYDGLRGTLIIRDPYQRHWSEGFADGLIEQYQAFGPRGMAMVPAEERAKLDSLTLLDTSLWDYLYRLDGALEAHRRDDADACHRAMLQEAPGHKLTLEAERRLMLYDANSAGMLSAVERMRELFPEDTVLQLARLSLLRDLSRREERMATLEREYQRPEAHPSFFTQYAQELAADAREHPKVFDLLKRAIRRNPVDAGNYYLMAGILCDQLKFEEALELYRIAACLEDKNESVAEAYFRMAHHRKQTESALDWMRRRVERFGHLSSQPIRTLDWALRRLHRDREAAAVLQAAIERRPEDGDLLLYAADVKACETMSHLDEASELCRRAERFCPRAQWLRGKARLARYRSDHQEALAIWREIVEMQPLAIDGHRAIATLLSEVESQAAALEYLRSVGERFPRHQPLLALWIEWLYDEPPEVSEPLIRRLIEINPSDAWAYRELGFLLLKQRRTDEAAACAETAGQLDPTHSSWHHLRGELFKLESRFDDARAEFRSALKLSVDNDFAIRELFSCCETAGQRIEELEFLRQELSKQVNYGDGLLGYRNYASQLIDPQELLRLLREALDARPDLWHAWSACVRQLTDMDELAQAFELACQATERFPMLPRIWLDRARVCQMRIDPDGELFALETGYEINPAWTDMARQLADLYLRKGDLPKAAELLERAVANDPLEGMNYGWLADIQWKLEQREAAFKNIERSVQLAPRYSWAWDCLRTWSNEAGEPERPLRVARELTERRPGESNSWLMLARMIGREEDQFEERLAAVDKAIELSPRSADAYDLRARVLHRTGRIEEALDACRPAIFGDHLPPELFACGASIQWEQGNRDQAIEEMRAAVDADPSFYDGWSTLSDWYEELGDHENCLEASKMMVRLNPHHDGALGHLAISLLNTGKREEAKEAFRRSFELSPSYQYGGLWLFDLQIEDDELEQAAETLNVLESHVSGPFVTSKRAILAARRKDRQSAQTAFRELCLDPDENPWPLRAAYEAMQEAKWLVDVRRIAGEAIDEESLHPEAGPRWVRAHVDDDQWDLDGRLRTMVERHPRAGGMAVHELVGAFLNANRKKQFIQFSEKEGPWLRTSAAPWGAVGWGMTAFKDYDLAHEWLKDWRTQTEAEPWMLVNAAEAFREKGLAAEANEISRHALTLAPDGGVPLHKTWLAADAIVAQDFDGAREYLSTVDPSSFDVDYTFLHTIATAVLDIVGASIEERSAVFRDVRKRLNAIAKYENMRRERARRKFYHYALGKIAGTVGGISPAIWRWRRVLLSY